MRHVHERLRLWIEGRRAPPTDPVAHAVRQELRDEVGREHEDEEPRPPPEQSNDCRRDEEHDAVRPDPGEEDEEPVEPAESMVDYPALEVAVGPPVAAMAAGRVEGEDAVLVGPLPDRALRHPEVFRGLAEGQPIRLAPRSKAMFVLSHASPNLPKTQRF